MKWSAAFNDIMKWMEASNIMVQRLDLGSEEYWQWLTDTLIMIRDRYKNDLVTGMLSAIIDYQGAQLAKLHGHDYKPLKKKNL